MNDLTTNILLNAIQAVRRQAYIRIALQFLAAFAVLALAFEAEAQQTIELMSGEANEGEAMSFTVKMTGTPSVNVDVTITRSIQSDDTVWSADFDQAKVTDSATLTFIGGRTDEELTHSFSGIRNDSLVEDDEVFTVQLTGSLPAGVSFSVDEVKGKILDNDSSAISIMNASGDEDSNDNNTDGTVNFEVQLTNAVQAGVTDSINMNLTWVASIVQNIDTAEDADFVLLSNLRTGTVSFSNSQTSRMFPIGIKADEIAEGNETFTVTLSGLPTDRDVTFTNDTAKGTILDNDNHTVSIADASAAEGGDISFTITLSGPSESPVVVNYRTSTEAGDTAESTDFTAVPQTQHTFPAGGMGTQTHNITVMTATDNVAEGDETFTVKLSGNLPPNVTFSDDTAEGTINNDDNHTVSIEDALAPEGDGVSFTITLSGPSESPVDVYYETSIEAGDTAESTDFTAVPQTQHTFPAGGTGPKTYDFTVMTVPDAVLEGDETFTVKLTGSLPDGVSFSDAIAEGKIIDNVVEAAIARHNRVNEELLPRISQISAKSALSAITNRIDSVVTGSASAELNMSTGGLFLHQLLGSTSKSLSDDTLSSAEVLGNSSFALPLNASADNGTDGAGSFAVWGSGDYHKLSSADGSLLDWDGSVVSFHVGGDMRFRHDFLAGLSVSRSLGSFDYTDRTDPSHVSGTYESRMTSVHPYMNWSLSEAFDVWATVGYGEGEIEIEDKGGTESSSTKMTTAALGASGKLLSDEEFLPGGTTTLRLKIEGSVARVEVAGNGNITPLSSDHQRVRLSIEGSHERPLDSGSLLTPSLEVSVRHDGGDSANGIGFELGGSLRYVDAATGLTLEARGRALVDDKHGREDWGVGGLIRLDPGNDRRGLSLSVSPTRGNLNSSAQQLWDTGMTEAAIGGDTQGGRVDAEIGYGIAVGGRGVMTPFGGLSMEEGDSRSYRMGARFDMASFLNLSIEGELREKPVIAPSQDIKIQGRLRW